MIYLLGSRLRETDLDTVKQSELPALIITNERGYPSILEALDIHAEVDISLSEILFCKTESQQECLYMTCVTRLLRWWRI